MARDHFRDIIPPSDGGRQVHYNNDSDYEEFDEDQTLTVASNDRSIRNINITRKAVPADPGRLSPKEGVGRLWLWVLAGICVLTLLILAFLYLFRQTTVWVTPHVQPVVFDKKMQFTAYPAVSAAPGALQYEVKAAEYKESSTLTASGTKHKETKATGSVIVYNNYSNSPIKLLKTTRFATDSGLIFRAPEAVEIPGKTAGGPGKVTILLVADQPGANYNVAANTKLTLPGLEGNDAMHAGVYANTVDAMTGGFSGDVPDISDDALATARVALQEKLRLKVQEMLSSISADKVALKPQIVFSDDTPSFGTDGNVIFSVTAQVKVPVLPREQLAAAIAQAVTADAFSIKYTLRTNDDFSADLADGAGGISNGPLTFSMSGSAALIAIVDKDDLSRSLAGKDSSAFQAIARNYPGIDSIHARIEPFWQSSFPSNPADIKIVIEEAK